MPTVSLNERGVVVRGCDSSALSSILSSRSRGGSLADGRGADIGVKVEAYVCRLVSPVADP